MKWLSLFLLLFLALGLNAAKVALIGDSNEANLVADLVLTKLSDDENITFLERMELVKIIQEQKLTNWSQDSNEMIRLGKILNVELFAVLHIEDKQYSFVVFDAKSAIRLVDQQLSENSTEQMVDVMAAMLKQASAKLHVTKTLRKVTLFSIRNVELSRDKDADCHKVASRLMSEIGRLPGFAVIESRYIGLINEERELTDITPSLSQASFLLSLDFYQSDTPGQSLIRAQVNTPGKEQKLFSMNCDLKTLQIPPEAIQDIVVYMRQETKGASISSAEEAARYYAEFKDTFVLKKYIERLAKIEAAVAYDNSNRNYQQCLLDTLAGCAQQEYYDMQSKRSPEEKVMRYLDQIERWDRLMSRYGFNLNQVNPMGYNPLLHSINGFDPLNGNHWTIPDFSEATRQRIIEFHSRYVYRLHAKCRLEYWMAPKTKLTSQGEMFCFDRDLTEMMNMYYPSQRECWTQCILLMKLYLGKTAQAPEEITNKNINGLVLSWHFWNRFFVCFKNIPADNDQFEELRKIAETGMSHPWAFVRLYSSFALYLTAAKVTPSKSEAALTEFMDRMTAIFQLFPPGKENNSLINLYHVADLLTGGALTWVKIPSNSFYIQMKKKLLDTMMQRHEMYFPLLYSVVTDFYDRKSYDMVKQLSEYLNAGKWQMIGGEDKKSAIISANDRIKLFLAKHLTANQLEDKTVRQLPFKVTKLIPFKHHAINAVFSDSERYIYWIAFNHESSSLEARCYDIISGQIREIGQNISVNPAKLTENSIAVGKNYLAFSIEWLHLVIVYNLETGKTIKLTPPFEQPKEIAIIDNTLLVWCNKDYYLLKYQLPSLKYKIIYSANRRYTPSDIFDNQTVSFDIMIPEQKRNRIVILLSGYNLKQPGWWYYYPEQDKFEYVGHYPSYSFCRWTKISEDSILLPLANYCFILDMKNNTKELLFYALHSDSASAQSMKRNFELDYGTNARVTLNSFTSSFSLSAGTIAGNYFWSNTPWYRIDLTTGTKTFYATTPDVNDRALLLRTTNNLNTLLLVNAKGIFNLHSIQDDMENKLLATDNNRTEQGSSK